MTLYPYGSEHSFLINSKQGYYNRNPRMKPENENHLHPPRPDRLVEFMYDGVRHDLPPSLPITDLETLETLAA
jgi:hypothetical protein